MRLPTLTIVLSAFLLSGCKKYEDGPALSVRTKLHRMTGEWKPEYFYINGHDSTSYLRSKLNCGKYVFYKDEDTHGRKLFVHRSEDLTFGTNGTWDFTDNKNDITISCNYQMCDTAVYHTLGAYGKYNLTWEIRRLKDDELWLRTNYLGREYLVKFRHPSYFY